LHIVGDIMRGYVWKLIVTLSFNKVQGLN